MRSWNYSLLADSSDFEAERQIFIYKQIHRQIYNQIAIVLHRSGENPQNV